MPPLLATFSSGVKTALKQPPPDEPVSPRFGRRSDRDGTRGSHVDKDDGRAVAQLKGVEGGSLSGHSEYVMQIMRDYFSSRKGNGVKAMENLPLLDLYLIYDIDLLPHTHTAR